MPSTQARACGDKQKHNTRREAKAHKWSLVNGKGASPKTLNVYKCKFCNKFHVGRSLKKRKR